MKKLTLLAVLLLAAGCSGNVKKSPADALRRDPYEFLAERLSASRDGAPGRKVAVLPFAYTDRRESDDGVVISERLLTRIIQEGRLEVVERSLLAKVMGELKLQNSGAMDAASIKSLGRVLGVDAVVTGTLTRQGDGSVEINARMIKAETAVVLTAAAATVPADWEASATQPAQAPAPAVQPQAAPQAPFPAPAAQPFPGAWRYRENFRVAEKSGAQLTDYPVLVKFDSAAAIRLGRMKSDCSDVRFANSDERSALSFWLEGGCGTPSARAWVKLPLLARGAVKNIYLYYGNPSAASASSGDETFRFFDDFGGGGIDASKWVLMPSGCPVSVMGGRLEFRGCSSGNATKRAVLRAVPQLKPPYAVEFEGMSTDGGTNGMRRDLGLRWDGVVTGAYNAMANSMEVSMFDGARITPDCAGLGCDSSGQTYINRIVGGVTAESICSSEKVLTPGVWRGYKVSDDGMKLSAYWGDRQLFSAEDSFNGGDYIGLSAREYPYGARAYFDNFRVRPLAAAEPEVYPYRPSAYAGGGKRVYTR